MKKIIAFLAVVSQAAWAQGDFPPMAGQEGSTAIFHQDPRIERWASYCEVERGPQDITNSALGDASFGEATAAIGASSPAVVSLGDGGSAILRFDSPITNVDGYDFAVFENSFSDTFLELAFVEVSSDGENYVRFPAISQTQTDEQVGGFGDLDPTKLHNLAGKYRAQYGTPFDLEELAGTENLDITAITHIRLIDVIGKIEGEGVSYDSQENPINDPWPTPFESSGFDLDAVAVLKASTIGIDERTILTALYPNPATNHLMIERKTSESVVLQVLDLQGRVLEETALIDKQYQLSLDAYSPGTYLLKVGTEFHTFIKQ